MTRAEAKARTRALLLDAAAQAFAQKGFAGASVDDIAGNCSSNFFPVGAALSRRLVESLAGQFRANRDALAAVPAERVQVRRTDAELVPEDLYGVAGALVWCGRLPRGAHPSLT
ncbi:TetR family transcriptional regulator [Streptomyces sp. NRRL F-5126]|uniref:TetR family transcriptional regulator n=1 Tax=Streptomyces sp. NRRL F-5126 TaxID=1463857 RepID=UPI0018FED2D5|nr:TetR family transcriptional regulator [Streptomyces sp. NRRL F-5126]